MSLGSAGQHADVGLAKPYNYTLYALHVLVQSHSIYMFVYVCLYLCIYMGYE